MSQLEVPIYEDLQDFTALKKFMEDALEDYNTTPGVIAMDLVLFRDAIEHSKSFSVCLIRFYQLPLAGIINLLYNCHRYLT